MNYTPKRAAVEQLVGYSLALLVLLAVFGTCGYTAVSCWHRGGTVLRNFFDWPTCVEARR